MKVSFEFDLLNENEKELYETVNSAPMVKSAVDKVDKCFLSPIYHRGILPQDLLDQCPKDHEELVQFVAQWMASKIYEIYNQELSK